MRFIIFIFKFITYSLIVLTLLVLAINYASPYYRYPAFKWLTTLVENEFVVKQIQNIEFKPRGFTNEITLTGLEIYNRNLGEANSVKIHQISGRLDLFDYWERRILFRKISIDSVSMNLETFLGILLSQQNIANTDLYRNLRVYLPKNASAKPNNLQSQPPSITDDSIKKLALDNRVLQKLTSEIELTNSKLLVDRSTINLKKATVSLRPNISTIDAQIDLDSFAEFTANFAFDNAKQMIFFVINDFPVSAFNRAVGNPKFDFLTSGIRTNLKGSFDYQNMVLQLDDIDIKSPLIQINGSLIYEQRNNRNLEIAARIRQSFDIQNLMRIWPAFLFDEETNNFVRTSFLAGEIEKADFVFNASLNDLNQIETKELFRFDLQAKNLLFNYVTDWQDIKMNHSVLKVTNLGLTAESTTTAPDAKKINVSANSHFFDLPAILEVKIDLESDNNFINDFIQSNPLKENQKLKSLLDVKLTGATQTQINLTIPLEKPDDMQYFGRVSLINNQMTLNDWIGLERINGSVAFDNNNVRSNFRALWWQNPITVSFRNRGENELLIDFDLDLIASNSLDNFFDHLKVENQAIRTRAKQSIVGQTKMKGKVIASNNPLPQNAKSNSLQNTEFISPLDHFNYSVSVSSSLVGIETDLFEPFSKAKNDSTPLSFQFSSNKGRLELQNIKFNDQINANLIKGVNTSLFDISVISLNLDSEKLKFLLDQKESKSLEEKINQTPLHALGLPNIDLTIYRLLYDDRDVGSLSAKLKIFPDRSEIQDIQLLSSTLEVAGEIVSSSKHTILTLKSLKQNPLSDYFTYLKYTPITKDAISTLDLNLTWPGQFWDYETKAVSGSLNILAGKGVLITNLQTSLIPGVIRELSVQSIRNRLENLLAFRKIVESLNPTTVFEEGIQFDNLTINLSFKDHKIFTDKMDFKSDSLNLSIKGFTDLTDDSLHMSALVQPDLFKVLPAVGIFTGNIPVALAGLITEKLVDTKEFFKVNYEIYGTTNNPQIRLQTNPTPAPKATN